MPRLVVPIIPSPAAASRAPSRATWYGMITCAAALTRSFDMFTPRDSSVAISSSSVRGLTTTPGPMIGWMCSCSSAARDQMELEGLVADDHGVAGVVAALVAHDE